MNKKDIENKLRNVSDNFTSIGMGRRGLFKKIGSIFTQSQRHDGQESKLGPEDDNEDNVNMGRSGSDTKKM